MSQSEETITTCHRCQGSGCQGRIVHGPREQDIERIRCQGCDGFGTYQTQTMRDPKRWYVFTWFSDNGLLPPVESEITDFLDGLENAR